MPRTTKRATRRTGPTMTAEAKMLERAADAAAKDFGYSAGLEMSGYALVDLENGGSIFVGPDAEPPEGTIVAAKTTWSATLYKEPSPGIRDYDQIAIASITYPGPYDPRDFDEAYALMSAGISAVLAYAGLVVCRSTRKRKAPVARKR